MADKTKAQLKEELVKYKLWYESVMKYGITPGRDYKCTHCDGPVSGGLCCAWCGEDNPK